MLSSQLPSALVQHSGFPPSTCLSFHLANIDHVPNAILCLHRVRDPLTRPDHPNGICFSLERVAVRESLLLSSPTRPVKLQNEQNVSEDPGGTAGSGNC